VVEYEAIQGIHLIFRALYMPGAIWCWVEHQTGHINPTIDAQSIRVHWISFGEAQTIGIVDYDDIEGIHTAFAVLICPGQSGAGLNTR
jgi:hypothetical protein